MANPVSTQRSEAQIHSQEVDSFCCGLSPHTVIKVSSLGIGTIAALGLALAGALIAPYWPFLFAAGILFLGGFLPFFWLPFRDSGQSETVIYNQPLNTMRYARWAPWNWDNSYGRSAFRSQVPLRTVVRADGRVPVGYASDAPHNERPVTQFPLGYTSDSSNYGRPLVQQSHLPPPVVISSAPNIAGRVNNSFGTTSQTPAGRVQVGSALNNPLPGMPGLPSANQRVDGRVQVGSALNDPSQERPNLPPANRRPDGRVPIGGAH